MEKEVGQCLEQLILKQKEKEYVQLIIDGMSWDNLREIGKKLNFGLEEANRFKKKMKKKAKIMFPDSQMPMCSLISYAVEEGLVSADSLPQKAPLELSKRESLVLGLTCRGYGSDFIAGLVLSNSRVIDSDRTRIVQKTGVRTLMQAVALGTREMAKARARNAK